MKRRVNVTPYSEYPLGPFVNFRGEDLKTSGGNEWGSLSCKKPPTNPKKFTHKVAFGEGGEECFEEKGNFFSRRKWMSRYLGSGGTRGVTWNTLFEGVTWRDGRIELKGLHAQEKCTVRRE